MESTSITIVPFTETDRHELSKLYDEVRIQAFTWLTKEHISLGSFDTDTRDEKVFVAKLGGELAGFVSVWEPENFVHHLYVYKRFQRNGIGQKLIEAVLQQSDSPVTLKCLENNHQAVNFYTKNGWTERRRGTSEQGGYILFEYVVR